MPFRVVVPVPGPLSWSPGRGPGCWLVIVLVPVIVVLAVLGSSAVLIALVVAVVAQLFRLGMTCVEFWRFWQQGRREGRWTRTPE